MLKSNQLMTIARNIALLIVATLASMAFFTLLNRAMDAEASIETGQEYFSTTTQPLMGAVTSDAALRGTTVFIKGSTSTPTTGSLGSVIVASTTIGTIAFYDATTTNITLRGNRPTTTLAVFGTSPTVGNYVFDIAYGTGLIMETSSNFNGNYIITYR